MNQQNISVAAIQMNCAVGDKEKNLQKAEKLIEEGVKKGAQFIVLPELFNTGYRTEEHDFALSEEVPGMTTEWMKRTAQKFNIILVGCILERGKPAGVIYDTCIAVEGSRLLGTYRKVHLWEMENTRFAKGNDYPVFTSKWGTFGIQICYEVGIPEGARILSLKGADILIYPSAFGKARRYAWDIATRSRALENGCFVIAANRTGAESGTEFGGYSRIVNPQGSVLAEAQYEDEIIIAEINLAEIPIQRKAIPYLRDLDTQLIYKELHNSL